MQKRGWYAEQDGSIRKSRNICGEPGDSNLKVLKIFERIRKSRNICSKPGQSDLKVLKHSSIKSIKILESQGIFVARKV